MCPGDDGSDKDIFELFSSEQDIEQQFLNEELKKREEEKEKLKKQQKNTTRDNCTWDDWDWSDFSDDQDEDLKDKADPDKHSQKRPSIKEEDFGTFRKEVKDYQKEKDKEEKEIRSETSTYLSWEDPNLGTGSQTLQTKPQNGEADYKSKLKLKISSDHALHQDAKKDNASDSDKNKYLNPSEWVGLGIVIKRNSDQEYEIIEVAQGGVGEILNFCVGDKLSLGQDTDIFDLTKDLRAGKFDKVDSLIDASGKSKIKFDEDTKKTFEATFKFGGARTYTINDKQKTVLKDNDELDIGSNIKDAKANFGLEREFVIREKGGKFVFKRKANKIRPGNDYKDYSLSCQQTKNKDAISKDLSIGKIDEYSFNDSDGNDKTDEVKKSFKENCIDCLILKISSEQYGLQNDDEIKIDKKEFLNFLNDQDNKEYLPLLISNYQNDKIITLENEKFKIEGKEVQFNSEALLKFVDFQIKCGSLSLFSKIGKYFKENHGDLRIDNLETKIKNPSVATSPLGASQVSVEFGFGRF